MGERVDDLLKSKDMTADTLAAELGISKAKLSDIINDKDTDFGYKTFVKLAKYFDVSIDYLLGISNNPSTDAYVKSAYNKTGLSHLSFEVLEFCHNYGYEEVIDTLNFIIEGELRDTIIEKSFITNSDPDPTIIIKSHHSLKTLIRIHKYFSVNTGSKDKILSISRKGNITSLSETNPAYADTLSSDDLISVKTIKQSELVEKILLDEVVDTLKIAKQEYLRLYGDNNANN